MNRREMLKAGIAGLLAGSMPAALLTGDAVYYPGMGTAGWWKRMRDSVVVIEMLQAELKQRAGEYQSATEVAMLEYARTVFR